MLIIADTLQQAEWQSQESFTPKFVTLVERVIGEFGRNYEQKSGSDKSKMSMATKAIYLAR
jgi:hypothetical protein